MTTTEQLALAAFAAPIAKAAADHADDVAENIDCDVEDGQATDWHAEAALVDPHQEYARAVSRLEIPKGAYAWANGVWISAFMVRWQELGAEHRKSRAA